MLYRKLFYLSHISLQNFHCFLLEFFLSVHCYRACVKLNSGHVRPVINLPYVSTLSERAAADQLIDHMTINGLHLELQSAYKKHHSTESALLKVKNDILMHRDAQKVNLLFLLNLSAAFDTVRHDFLLDRLNYGTGPGDFSSH